MSTITITEPTRTTSDQETVSLVLKMKNFTEETKKRAAELVSLMVKSAIFDQQQTKEIELWNKKFSKWPFEQDKELQKNLSKGICYLIVEIIHPVIAETQDPEKSDRLDDINENALEILSTTLPDGENAQGFINKYREASNSRRTFEANKAVMKRIFDEALSLQEEESKKISEELEKMGKTLQETISSKVVQMQQQSSKFTSSTTRLTNTSASINTQMITLSQQTAAVGERLTNQQRQLEQLKADTSALMQQLQG